MVAQNWPIDKVEFPIISIDPYITAAVGQPICLYKPLLFAVPNSRKPQRSPFVSSRVRSVMSIILLVVTLLCSYAVTAETSEPVGKERKRGVADSGGWIGIGNADYSQGQGQGQGQRWRVDPAWKQFELPPSLLLARSSGGSYDTGGLGYDRAAAISLPAGRSDSSNSMTLPIYLAKHVAKEKPAVLPVPETAYTETPYRVAVDKLIVRKPVPIPVSLAETVAVPVPVPVPVPVERAIPTLSRQSMAAYQLPLSLPFPVSLPVPVAVSLPMALPLPLSHPTVLHSGRILVVDPGPIQGHVYPTGHLLHSHG